ncbi:MAG: glycosyltransferase N-terminal domain-containing protein [Blastochloris sp.]|nr:glycosyltransferase N-terminal domain-containing protein [Blastochloris sp.]
MLQWFYNVGFTLAFVLTWPWFALHMWRRGNFWRGFNERFSFYSPELQSRLSHLKEPIWIHAVSVGEMMLARVLVDELRLLRPDQGVVITCTTSTGRALGDRELEDDKTVVMYSPADLLPMARRAFRAIKPCMILLMEQELWPNQLWEAERRGVPVWIVNARLSDRSWERFKKFRFYTTPFLSKISLIGLQSERDRGRLAEAGFPVHSMFVTGSMKYDVAHLAQADQGVAEGLRKEMGWTEGTEVFLAGSTHPGEEELVLEAYQELKRKRPELKCLLAPRHAERASSLMAAAQGRGFTACLRTEARPEADVLILNTTGELRSLYELGTIIFIGKTLVAPKGKGGQNFLEAARVGGAIVLGDKVENFTALVEDYLEASALVQVKDVEGLKNEALRLLEDRDLRCNYGSKARKLFEENLGAGATMARMIDGYLGSKAATT